MSNKQLTDKQYRFAQEYIHSETATEAAIKAGYKTGANVRAATLLKNPLIQQLIKEERNKLANQWDIKRNQLVIMLLDAYNNAKTATEMISACKELGMLLDLYPRGDSNGSEAIGHCLSIEEMSDEELLGLIQS